MGGRISGGSSNIKILINEIEEHKAAKNPHNITLDTTGVICGDPPKGKCKVTNLFVDPSTGRLEVEYEDEPVS